MLEKKEERNYTHAVPAVGKSGFVEIYKTK